MEMLQLRYFFESAKTESFAKTAEKYMVPPTSVSAAVKRLEKELGCELFNRSSNRITINEKGKKLLSTLEEVFGKLEETLDSLTAVSTDKRNIKMLVCAMRGEITERIIEYKTNHPHIAFKTVFNFDETSFNDYDIIIDEKTDKYHEYESIDLCSADIRLRVSASSPLCGKKLTLKMLSAEPFISIGENNGMHKILVNACKRAGFTPNIVVQSNDIWCNQKCVQAGIGIGMGREYQRKKLSDNIKYLDVTDFKEKQTICIYYKKDSAYGNVEHFLRFLRNKTF